MSNSVGFLVGFVHCLAVADLIYDASKNKQVICCVTLLIQVLKVKKKKVNKSAFSSLLLFLKLVMLVELINNCNVKESIGYLRISID